MRKIAVFLLCLMLIAMPALAEVYTSNTGLFTYECPDDCIALTGDFVTALLNGDLSDYIDEEIGNMGFEGAAFDELYDELKNMDLSNMDLIYTPDMTGSANIYVQRGIGLTKDMLPLLADALEEEMVSVYTSIGASEDNIKSLGLQEYAGIPYYVVYVDMGALAMHQYMTFTEGGDQIVVTFSGFPQDDEIALMESIKML